MSADHPEVYTVPASGGQAVPLMKVDPANRESFPLAQFPAGWKALAVCNRRATASGAGTTSIGVLSLETGRRRGCSMQSLPCSMLDPDISCIAGKNAGCPAFDAQHLRVTGEAFPVAEEVRSESIPAAGIFTVSQNGHLAYQSGPSQLSQLMWVDRSGTVIANVGPPANYGFPSLSHDGRKAAVLITIQPVQPTISGSSTSRRSIDPPHFRSGPQEESATGLPTTRTSFSRAAAVISAISISTRRRSPVLEMTIG